MRLIALSPLNNLRGETLLEKHKTDDGFAQRSQLLCINKAKRLHA